MRDEGERLLGDARVAAGIAARRLVGLTERERRRQAPTGIGVPAAALSFDLPVMVAVASLNSPRTLLTIMCRATKPTRLCATSSA